MNGRKAKQLRSIAKEMVKSNVEFVVNYFVEKQEDGTTKQSLIPMPAEWALGTFRRVYQDLK